MFLTLVYCNFDKSTVATSVVVDVTAAVISEAIDAVSAAAAAAAAASLVAANE